MSQQFMLKHEHNSQRSTPIVKTRAKGKHIQNGRLQAKTFQQNTNNMSSRHDLPLRKEKPHKTK
jgi:hypothetical protein